MTMLTIPAHDGGAFQAYVAMPEKTPAPAILVIQEIFGINQEMRDKCDALARAGYIALCPDLFWRLEPGVELTDRTEEEWKKALDLMNRFDVAQGVEDLRAAAHTLKGHADCTGKVGCVGYCLGGKMAYLMAGRGHLDGAVSYYGVGLDALLGDVPAINCPLMLHIAEEDKFVSKAAQEKIRAGVAGNPLVTVHSYPGVDHAFARGGGQHYDGDAAALAHERTAAFFRQTLGGAQPA